MLLLFISVKIHDSEQTLRRQRTMLSQTSWRSLPLIPNLIRSFSTTKSERNSGSETPEVSGCGACMFYKPRPSTYQVSQIDEPSAIKAHSLKDIDEDEETHNVENKSRQNKDIQVEFHNEVKNKIQNDKEQSKDEEITLDRDVTM